MARPRVLSRLALAVLAGGFAAFACAAAASAQSTTVTEVEVESVRPKTPRHETLRFLKENRAFLRARLDLLRQKATTREASPGAIDPRFLAYRDMLASIHAGEDSIAKVADARERTALLERIAELGRLEEELDGLDKALGAQRERLAALERDFTGRQETALLVVASGSPRTALREVAISLEDGSTVRVPLGPTERAALESGGVAEIFHGFVEPRAQVVEIALSAEAWTQASTGFVTLEPARDRLTFLRLDLSAVDAAAPGAGLAASTWIHDATIPGER